MLWFGDMKVAWYQIGTACHLIFFSQGYIPFIAELGRLCSKLDVLVGFAVASTSAPVPYVKPEVVERDEGVLQLDDARHPCLEQVIDLSKLDITHYFTFLRLSFII